MTKDYTNKAKIQSWKKRIKKAGLKQYQVAERAGISGAYLTEIMKGRYDPKASLVDKVESILKRAGAVR